MDLPSFLRQYVSPTKLALFDEMLPKRTRYLTVVLEDIFQAHNSSAVMRSCEGFGLQDVHVIENKYRWEQSTEVDRGSSKWLSIYRYNKSVHNTATCIDALRDRGYSIVATTPAATQSIEETPVHRPLALVLGTERYGVSQEVLERCDQQVRIPMYGFTSSLNVSVAAAVCLHTLRRRIMEADVPWQLSKAEEEEIRLLWYKRCLLHHQRYIQVWEERYATTAPRTH
jgi:tRNA (guanosine-2'-O-)-methyltransferase